MIWKSLNIDDQQLVQLCQQKNRKAQNFLFEKYKRKVLFICMRYTSDNEEAKDILQEAFIKIFKSIASNSTSSSIESLPAWIHKIASRTAIDSFRRKKELVFLEDIGSYPVVNQEATPIENMSAQELLAIVQMMPDGYRIIFNMFIIEGYDHGEIAELLNISKATSRSQLTRAKEWLKKRLDTENINYYGRVFG